ncbi:hypothetical protein BGX30_007369 [Mortierella sp. GBA39]|nr:hypothetical protein BGX30_007369 [Mortierella sp. GBA39]
MLHSPLFRLVNKSKAGTASVTSTSRSQADVYHISRISYNARNGDPAAQVLLGDIFKEGSGVDQDLQVAINWHTRAADQGHARGQFSIGVMYGQGLVVVQDFVKTADGGDERAQNTAGVGFVHDRGLGVPQDHDEAWGWFMKAAALGDASAQYILGLLYGFGQGIERNVTIARNWTLKAAEQRHAAAQNAAGFFYNYSTADYQQAMHWYHKAAEKSYSAG